MQVQVQVKKEKHSIASFFTLTVKHAKQGGFVQRLPCNLAKAAAMLDCCGAV